jgi:hypothetical protein
MVDICRLSADRLSKNLAVENRTVWAKARADGRCRQLSNGAVRKYCRGRPPLVDNALGNDPELEALGRRTEACQQPPRFVHISAATLSGVLAELSQNATCFVVAPFF